MDIQFNPQPFHKLPKPIWATIISYLTDREMLRLSRTDKKMHAMMRSLLGNIDLWKMLLENALYNFIPIHFSLDDVENFKKSKNEKGEISFGKVSLIFKKYVQVLTPGYKKVHPQEKGYCFNRYREPNSLNPTCTVLLGHQTLLTLFGGDTPLIEAIRNKNRHEAIYWVRHEETDLDIQVGCKITALKCALTHHQPDIARLIIEKGAKLDTKDQWGSTPVQGAIYGGYVDLILMMRRVVTASDCIFSFVNHKLEASEILIRAVHKYNFDDYKNKYKNILNYAFGSYEKLLLSDAFRID